MTEHNHEWYVVGSYESVIGSKDGWADLKLDCIADDQCFDRATVMIKIDPNRIRIQEKEE